jgi:hypothetical protein
VPSPVFLLEVYDPCELQVFVFRWKSVRRRFSNMWHCLVPAVRSGDVSRPTSLNFLLFCNVTPCARQYLKEWYQHKASGGAEQGERTTASPVAEGSMAAQDFVAQCRHQLISFVQYTSILASGPYLMQAYHARGLVELQPGSSCSGGRQALDEDQALSSSMRRGMNLRAVTVTVNVTL